MLTPKTVIFDVGNVLLEWNPRNLFRRLITDENEMEFFLREVCPSEWSVLQDDGRDLREAMESRVRLFPQYAALIHEYYGPRHVESVGGAIQGVVEVLRELRAAGKFKLLALTNWHDKLFAPVREIYWDEVFQYLDGIVCSGEEKITKPDPRLFKILFDRYETCAAESVLIDDSPYNTHGAEACGLQSILYTNPAVLRESLGGLGIVLP